MKLEIRFFELSKNSEKATEIYNHWLFIKKDITNQLDNVSVYFPHFSLHDSSHSETIISQMERILGEDRINVLSFSDIFLLLLVAYSHDLGMVLNYSEVEEYFESDEYFNDLNRFSQDENSQLYQTSKRLSAIDIVNDGTQKDYIKSLQIYEDVLKLVEYHFRSNHATRSSEKLDKYLCGKLQINRVIGIRIIRLIAKICELHQMDYSHIMELPLSTNGISDDYCHPRFVAFMLCLGDLLDLDTDRFNEYYLETTTPLPKESELHKEKHESILHYLVNTNGVEIIAECKTKEVYRILQDWVEWIDDLLKFGALNWSRLVQNDFGNSPSLIKREISFANNKSWIQYNDLKFSISQGRAVELLQGVNIYRSKFVFLREIIQNAVDASLIQLWDKYEQLEQLGEVTSIIENNFPERLVEELDISLKIKDVSGQVQIELRDYGTGISLEDILNISKVGNRTRKNEVLNKIPEWLKPAGAFGLGLQSIFIVTDAFEIITKTNNEKAKKIRFESTTNGKGYIDIEDYNEPFERGSCIFVKIDNKKISFEDLYCSRFDYETESKSRLIQRRLYNEYNNTSDGIPIGFRRQMKLNDYVNVNWEIVTDEDKKVVDEKLYATIFDENFLEITKGMLVIKFNTLHYKYFDQDTLSICSLCFVDFYGDNKIIKYDKYNDSFNASLFYKHEFVKDEIIKDRIALSRSSHYKNFDFSVNLLSGNAEDLLTIDRKGIKEESEHSVIKIVEKSVMKTCTKLIDDLISSKKNDIGSLIFKIFETAIYFDYRVEEFYQVYHENMAQYSFGNYLSVEADVNSKEYNKVIKFDELYKNEIIFICKEVTAESEGLKNKIIDLDSEKRVFWLAHNKIQTPNYVVKMCVSHKILKGFLGRLRGKVYYCINVKPFKSGNLRNEFEKDDYFVLYDFIFALINDYRVMSGNNDFPEISVVTEYNRFKKESILYELIFSEEQRLNLKNYLLNKCNEFDENTMMDKVITSYDFEKTVSYVARVNNSTIKIVSETYKSFIKKLLGLVKNKKKMSPYIDEFLKEINSNPRTLYPSHSKLEEKLYSNDYII